MEKIGRKRPETEVEIVPEVPENHEKLKQIRKEKTRLNKLFAEVDEKKRKVVDGLVEECAFMRAELTELREFIIVNGVVDEMPQGNYSIIRESPYVRTYHTMIQRYTTAMKELLALLPKNAPAASMLDDGFDDFVDSRE